MSTLTEWQIGEIVETCLKARGYKAKLEVGGDGSPEIFSDLSTKDTIRRLHFANYAYLGLGVEVLSEISDKYGAMWEEHYSYPRLEIDLDRPIVRQVENYLTELEEALSW